MKNTLLAIDTFIDKVFDKRRGSKFLDKIFFVASEAADFAIAWHLIALSLLAFDTSLFSWWVRFIVCLVIESIIVNQIIKRIFNRQRPPISEKLSIHGRRPKTTSFPSGHASSAALASFLLSVAAPSLIFIWITLAVIVAASRIYNRMHHLTDVVAGGIIGFGLAVLAVNVWTV